MLHKTNQGDGVETTLSRDAVPTPAAALRRCFPAKIDAHHQIGRLARNVMSFCFSICP